MIIKYHLFSTFYLSQKIKGETVFNNKNPWNKKEEDENFIFKGLTQKPKEEAKSPAEILYQNSNEEKNRQNKNNEYKNELLSMLGNNATAADVLYSDNTELENKVKNLNSKNNSNNSKPKESLTNKVVKTTAETLLGKAYDFPGYAIAKKKFGPDTTGMVDLAHGDKMQNRDYIKDVIHIKNYNDPSVESDKKYLSDKISSQFKDYNFDINKIKGYFFKNDSEPSQRMTKDEGFKKVIKENKENILNGKDISIAFPRYSDRKKSNFHYALGHADIRNGYIDKEGNLRIKVYDTYDFNKENTSPLNQAGRDSMIKGELKPYFSIHDIMIPKKDLDELWK